MSDQKDKKPIEKLTDAASQAARAESEPAPVRRHRAVWFQVALVLVVGAFAGLMSVVSWLGFDPQNIIIQFYLWGKKRFFVHQPVAPAEPQMK